jgi:hypothetical protein
MLVEMCVRRGTGDNMGSAQKVKEYLKRFDRSLSGYLFFRKLETLTDELLGKKKPIASHDYYAFKNAFNFYKAEELEEVVLHYMPDRKVRLALELVKGAYGEGKRTSGNTRVSHVLRVAMMAAAFGEGKNVVIAGLLHDIVEDALAGKAVCPYWDGTGGKEEMLKVIGEIFGLRVAQLVGILTDDGKDYPNYLRMVYLDPDAAKLKKIDKIVNLWELDNIENMDDRMEKVEKTLEKSRYQIMCELPGGINGVGIALEGILHQAFWEVENWSMELAKGKRDTPLQENGALQGSKSLLGHPPPHD